MARPKKKQSDPNSSMEQLIKRAVTLFDTPYDDRDERDPSLPSLRSVAEEMGTTILRVRKLLITADYYTSSTSRAVQEMMKNGFNIEEVMAELNLGRASVYSYIPYRNLAFNLDQTTVNADRHRIFRRREKACEELKTHLGLPDETLYLWKAVIAFEDYPFKTLGRGKEHTGAVKFKYRVSRMPSSGGHHFAGASIDGFGNEMWVRTDDGEQEKSISRSTVDLALKNALEEQKQHGCVSGPRKLGVPGSRSYLYAMFLRFGVIEEKQGE